MAVLWRVLCDHQWFSPLTPFVTRTLRMTNELSHSYATRGNGDRVQFITPFRAFGFSPSLDISHSQGAPSLDPACDLNLRPVHPTGTSRFATGKQ